MSLLATVAAFGVARLVFQDGVLDGLLGWESQGFVDAWAPIFFFALIFALAMDYTVFLLATVKDVHDRTGDAAHALVEGLAGTGRVINAAAGVMVVVFMTFALSGPIAPKEMGVILAVAVLLDATLIRLLLQPVVLRLLGARAWWMPAWLDRLVPNVGVSHGRPAGSRRLASWRPPSGAGSVAQANGVPPARPDGSARRRDTASSLGGLKQRALLARLLVSPNRTVAVDRLVDDLWGEAVPDSAAKMVQIFVSQLRKAAPGRGARDPPARLPRPGRSGGDRHRPLRSAAPHGPRGARGGRRGRPPPRGCARRWGSGAARRSPSSPSPSRRPSATASTSCAWRASRIASRRT